MIFQTILTFNSVETQADQILMGDTVTLWGSTTITFED